MLVLFLKYWPLEVGGKNNWEGKVYLQSSEPQITLIEGFMSCLQNALELHPNFSLKKTLFQLQKCLPEMAIYEQSISYDR